MGGYAMTSVMGTLVLVAMTGLTITNHHRNQNTATGKSSESSSLDTTTGARLLRPGHDNDDHALTPESAKELERALAREDEALWASYERYQQHPRNVRAQKEKKTRGHAASTAAAAVDPMMVNSVYSLNTKSELTAGIDAAEFVVRQQEDHAADDDPSRPRAIVTTAEQATTMKTDGHQQQEEEVTLAAVVEEERPFDFYDPSLTAVQKREYVKKVVYFTAALLFFYYNSISHTLI